MKPPYTITTDILRSISAISEKLGEVNARYLSRPEPQLRKQSRIRTIQSSLQIEGNTLNEQQVSAILENKRVIGPEKDIREVLNAIDVYEKLDSFSYTSARDFLKAHQLLMKGLVNRAGFYRQQSVGIVKGGQITHVAPPSANVPSLMKNLFQYLKDKEEIPLLKSCVFHYEMEFIHPFMDGNGRMGRLWQTLILMREYPVFEFLPLETLIRDNQEDYYKALAMSDKKGESTAFMEYMLDIINRALSVLLQPHNKVLNEQERMAYFLAAQPGTFTRKDYLNCFKSLSPATASRDLRKGVEEGLLQKSGDKKNTIYTLVKS